MGDDGRRWSGGDDEDNDDRIHVPVASTHVGISTSTIIAVNFLPAPPLTNVAHADLLPLCTKDMTRYIDGVKKLQQQAVMRIHFAISFGC